MEEDASTFTTPTNLLRNADILKRVVDWASRRCPADDESVPCPLCGARADIPGDTCKAVESIFPSNLLRDLRAALASQDAGISGRDIFAVYDGGNSITVHFSEVKSAREFRNFLELHK